MKKVIPTNVYQAFEDAGKKGDIPQLQKVCAKYLEKYPKMIGCALRKAVDYKQLTFVEFLIREYGSHLTNDSINDALLSCFLSKNSEFAITLIRTGRVDFDEPLSYWGSTPMTYAAAQGMDDVVECLLKAGAAVDCRDRPVSATAASLMRCDTALIGAVRANRCSTVALLLRHGADVNAIGQGGRTALDRAGRSPKRQALRDSLLKCGAKTGKELSASAGVKKTKPKKGRPKAAKKSQKSSPLALLEAACDAKAKAHPEVKGATFVTLKARPNETIGKRYHKRLESIRAKLASEFASGGDFIVRQFIRNKGFALTVLSAKDKFAVIRKLGFSIIEFGISNRKAIEFLKSLEETATLELLGCDRYSLEARFTGRIRTPQKLAKAIIEFCPFVLEVFEADADFRTLGKHLKEGGEFCLYWE